MIAKLFDKLYGNAVVLANSRGQCRVPYLSQEKLWALRDARLRWIVMYAAKTVPYYRSLFKEMGIDPHKIKTVEDLDRLPLLDKKAVRKNPHLFVSTSRRGQKSIHFITSGATGTPLEIYHDLNSLLANIAFSERERDVITRFYGSAYGYKELHINYSASTVRKVWDFYRQWTFIPLRPDRLTLSVLEPIQHIVEAINRFRPDIIFSYGSYLETLFRTLELRRIKIHLPRILIYGADSMTGEGRKLIEEKFGIPVLSRYNAVEAFKIGFFCEERKGFHLHEDLCHAKIVDANGQRLANGKKGEVVISNLVNRGTVLLNYRLGDMASMSSERCPCGRTLPLLSELEGRVEDIIFLPSGKFIHPRAVWNVFKGRKEVLQYQLIQHEPERFELRLVTVDSKTYQSVINGILADLRHLLGKSSIIESEYYQELERQGSGKFRPVINNLT
jgi:phenylacetate-CoA ligase